VPGCCENGNEPSGSDDNIMDLKEIVSEDVDGFSFQLAQDRAQCRAVVKTVMNLWIQ
jgi:hypothetical protein